jgi:hypothetical protein
MDVNDSNVKILLEGAIILRLPYKSVNPHVR